MYSEDLLGRPLEGGHRRQHRHVGRLVVVLVLDGQRPEVGRGPHEDDGEQHHRGPRQAVGDRRPADQHRHRPGRPADDDVLAAGPLQPQRVDEDVEQGGRHGQHGREQVDPGPQLDEGQHLEADGEDQGVAGGDRPGDQRPLARAVHELVDVPVDVHVDGVGPTGGQGPAEQGGHHQPHRRQAPLGHDHGGQRGDQQELDDPRLGERHVGADPGSERDSAGQGHRRKGHRRKL